MIAVVVDTHTLIWYLSGDRRLSDLAKQFLTNIAEAGDQAAVSTISIVEISYLSEKGRLSPEWPTTVIKLFDEADALFVECPINLEVAKSLMSLADSGIADMPDRIIAATARLLNVPLLTRDRAITNSPVATLW